MRQKGRSGLPVPEAYQAPEEAAAFRAQTGNKAEDLLKLRAPQPDRDWSGGFLPEEEVWLTPMQLEEAVFVITVTAEQAAAYYDMPLEALMICWKAAGRVAVEENHQEDRAMVWGSRDALLEVVSWMKEGKGHKELSLPIMPPMLKETTQRFAIGLDDLGETLDLPLQGGAAPGSRFIFRRKAMYSQGGKSLGWEMTGDGRWKRRREPVPEGQTGRQDDEMGRTKGPRLQRPGLLPTEEQEQLQGLQDLADSLYRKEQEEENPEQWETIGSESDDEQRRYREEHHSSDEERSIFSIAEKAGFIRNVGVPVTSSRKRIGKEQGGRRKSKKEKIQIQRSGASSTPPGADSSRASGSQDAVGPEDDEDHEGLVAQLCQYWQRRRPVDDTKD